MQKKKVGKRGRGGREREREKREREMISPKDSMSKDIKNAHK